MIVYRSVANEAEEHHQHASPHAVRRMTLSLQGKKKEKIVGLEISQHGY